jgi:hypothetical protein
LLEHSLLKSHLFEYLFQTLLSQTSLAQILIVQSQLTHKINLLKVPLAQNLQAKSLAAEKNLFPYSFL